MAQDDLYLEFLKKLQKEFSPADFQDFVEGLVRYGTAQMNTAFFVFLEEEDLKALDELKDEQKREEELIVRFKNRSGVTPDEFLENLRDTIAKHHLFPELRPKASTNQSTTTLDQNKSK